MTNLADGEERVLNHCGECGGMWIDVSDLNRLLLRNNLPGLERLGGKVDQDTLSGHCPDCQVDFVRVTDGAKNDTLSYDTCESCGGIFLNSDFGELKTVDDGERAVVDFFSRFAKSITKPVLG